MSPGPLGVQRLGRISYPQAEAQMLYLLKTQITNQTPDTLLLVEPDPVYTVGRRRGAQDNVLAPGEVPVVPTTHNKDVTFHGPGQVVGWPVVALPEGRRELPGQPKHNEQQHNNNPTTGCGRCEVNNGTIKALQQKRKALQDELDAGLTLDLRLLHFGELASEGKGATPSEVADLVDAWASWRCLTWATRDAETRASDAMLTAAAMHLARRGER